jgi:sulfate/thiosulfate transport system ATP-binding protein
MSIVLHHITKRFGRQTVVEQVSLEVADGELFVLLGASGSGKSTILRMIAGLTEPDGGRILLHGRDVTNLSPQERGTGFVFQNYSIFRHMNVARNIEFGMKVRKVPASRRAERREELLDLVGLAGLGNRFSSQLSGGQQQRVALARALAYEPSVLLLDEPFGALDVKIRMQLRRSLKEIQRKLAVTTILVTHDQEEAFELADRIAVLERGRLLEVGTGETLYSRPRTLPVATFLGAGTVLVGRARGGSAHFGSFSLPIPEDVPHEDGAAVQVLFRPEQVRLSEQEPEDSSAVLGRGTIIEQNFTGSLRRIRLSLPRIEAVRQLAPPVPFGEEGLLVEAILPSEKSVEQEQLWVSLRGWRILKRPAPRLMVFDDASGSTATLAAARLLAEGLKATATVLAVAANPRSTQGLHDALGQRRGASGLQQSELRVRYGEPAEQIIAEQNEMLYDMLIIPYIPRRFSVPTPRTDGVGSTVARVLNRTDVPVMVVKKEPAKISRILICTAVGEPGKKDVLVGGRLARQLKAAVTLLHVNLRGDSTAALTQSHLKRAEATFRTFDIASEVRIRQASTPAAGILAEAEEGGHDLIVVGGHGPRRRLRRADNDVTMQVIADSDRPVLIVPTD